MKIVVKSSLSGILSSGQSSEVTVEAADYEAAEATSVVLAILAQNGIGKMPGSDGDDDSVGMTSERDEPDEDEKSDPEDNNDPDPALALSSSRLARVRSILTGRVRERDLDEVMHTLVAERLI